MSIMDSYQFNLLTEENNVISFQLEDSSFMARIFILEEDIIRVLLTPSSEPEVKQTWAVAPGMDDVPMEGRNRLDISPFTLPAYSSIIENNYFIVETSETANLL